MLELIPVPFARLVLLSWLVVIQRKMTEFQKDRLGGVDGIGNY